MPEKSKSDQSEGAEVSRREALKRELKIPDAEDLEMPPCAASYLVLYLWEMGPVVAGSMSGVPLSFLEIQAWQDCTGIELNAWESRSLRRLSIVYLGESQRATKPDCPMPWEDSTYARNAPIRAVESLRNSIRGLASL